MLWSSSKETGNSVKVRIALIVFLDGGANQVAESLLFIYLFVIFIKLYFRDLMILLLLETI